MTPDRPQIVCQKYTAGQIDRLLIPLRRECVRGRFHIKRKKPRESLSPVVSEDLSVCLFKQLAEYQTEVLTPEVGSYYNSVSVEKEIGGYGPDLVHCSRNGFPAFQVADV